LATLAFNITSWALFLFPLCRFLVLVSTASWLLCSGLLRIYTICQAIAAMQLKTKRVSLMKDVNKEEVEKVMKKVDNRNLRRISRMLLEADVKAAEEQEKLKDISMQKVLKSVETRNIRKISKSLQGVDVSRVLSHFSALSQGTSPRSQPVLPKTSYAKTKHVTVFEAYDEGSSEETDPLSSSESSYAESERSFKTSSMVYSSNRNNNITMNNNNNNNVSPKDLSSSPGDEPDALKRDHVFVKFAESQEMREVLQLYSDLKSELGLEDRPSTFTGQFQRMKQGLVGKVPDRYAELLRLLGDRAGCKEYLGNSVAAGKRVAILGGGPCGLRLAMETQMLGAETVVLEARESIDRNNVIKLWAFVMEDLKTLGAKKLYPGLGCGAVNHIAIRQLQLLLLKMTLLLGVTVRVGESFREILRPTRDRGWVVVSQKMMEGGLVQEENEYDIVMCATGRKVPLEGFERRSLEAQMSIAITANWKNLNSPEERIVEEIPGLSKQYDMEFFRNLENKCGIRLENIVYYKDLTHYFVMTAKKDSLVRKGVIRKDTDDRESLLHPDNVDFEALKHYASEAASFSTNHFSTPLPATPLAEWKGREDVSIFDFTHIYSSQNACRVRQQRGHRLLLGLVGDSLLEPFWPEGTGIGRGFLGVLDTAWMVRRFCLEGEGDMVYEVIREREKLYSLLRQTTDSRLKGHFYRWTIDPVTRQACQE